MPKKKQDPEQDPEQDVNSKGYLATSDNSESPTIVVQWKKRQQGWPMSAIRSWEMLPLEGQLRIILSTDHEVFVTYEHPGDVDYFGLLDAIAKLTIKAIFTTPKKSMVRVYQMVPDGDGGMERKEVK